MCHGAAFECLSTKGFQPNTEIEYNASSEGQWDVAAFGLLRRQGQWRTVVCRCDVPSTCFMAAIFPEMPKLCSDGNKAADRPDGPPLARRRGAPCSGLAMMFEFATGCCKTQLQVLSSAPLLSADVV